MARGSVRDLVSRPLAAYADTEPFVPDDPQ